MQEIVIPLKEKSYKVFLGELPEIKLKQKALIISDSIVAGLHLPYLLERLNALEVRVCVIESGEKYKNFHSLERILNNAFEMQLNRHSLMIALGGGVISDMVGFASSIYFRGIDFINIPTTLLAQVDASVGGKTGINTPYGKNLIGSFHQPKAVYMDLAFLKTLEKREFQAGVAEIIKMAVCFDKNLVERLETKDLKDCLEEVIFQSVNIKAQVVVQDEKERNIRAGLNYGHTFGHAIENETDYERFLHGEAIAIGMCMANDLALSLGMLTLKECERIENLLKKFDLIFNYQITDIQKFYERLFLDKKSENKTIKFILPKGIGAFEMASHIPKETILKVLEKWH
ncbi:3-dehydroquinate synthase [Helicobacter pylori]|uniref:3-dehydroquinate synthase n=1 Tax=Helicobacter pylori TaxID=210 RepID=A0A1V3BAG2_HELPX|nr:3-dehydroquinate synthase [Helicobacter pylori]EJB29993.1 3-dehydroquinate synthase [Helicobacter pylori NQ4228]MBM0611540.1 3-dehydroquinate synthase [Helicobacter pylori]MBM0628020.1 3-dehydroquinate synthase [Helicobacter pylori]MDO7808196.1 3-dehydroquinate synthase [Helicobacter pylori]MDO7809826.1 3-dehydroquinate synthase [Helicobacter pylori]